MVAPVVADGEGDAGRVASLDHAVALPGVARQHLLDQHVLAGGGGVQRRRQVEVVRKQDVDRLDLRHRQHLVVVAHDGHVRSQQLVDRLVARRHRLGDRHHLAALRRLAQRRSVRPQDAAAAQHTDLDSAGLHCASSFITEWVPSISRPRGCAADKRWLTGA